MKKQVIEKPKLPEMITQSIVLGRGGWNTALFTSLLGKPDILKKHSLYKTMIKLFLLSRVVDAEQTDTFKNAQANIAKRKLSALKAVETKVTKLLAAVEKMTIKISIKDNVQSSAISSYNDYHYDACASSKDDKAFLDRITVNYIRHELSIYDTALESVAGKAGIYIAIDLIRDKIYNAIAKQYPTYAAECKRQRLAR